MRTLPCLFFLSLVVLLPLTGCKPSATDSGSAKDYEIRGKVTAVDATKQTVTLDHEAIPGLMQGMTMAFKVEDQKLLSGIQTGDKVQGRLKKTDAGMVITKLEKR